MPVLHEPDRPFNSFVLTPEWNACLADWTLMHPDKPHGPRFTAQECVPFVFKWPATRRDTQRAPNGRFVKA